MQSPREWEFLTPPQTPDEIGRLGCYRALKVIGTGGMGVVFKAEDVLLKRIVALKAMLPSVVKNASAKDRFFREARAVAALHHDHVVRIYQVGEDKGTPFLAMEFLLGESLDCLLGRVGTLSVLDALRIAQEVAQGLAAAHDCGLVHRDIKPANIWLEKRPVNDNSLSFGLSKTDRAAALGRVKILDFGLAHTLGDGPRLTQTGMIVGTPAYMPPEQADGKTIDRRSDLYSLGVVLYRMVTGQVPFKGNSPLAVIAALAVQTPTAPSSLNPKIPNALNDLILRLISKEPATRPSCAREVYRLLGRIETSNAKSPSTMGVPRKALASERQSTIYPSNARTRSARTSFGDAESGVRAMPVRKTFSLFALIGVFAGVIVTLGALVVGVFAFFPKDTGMGEDSGMGEVLVESDDLGFQFRFDKVGPTVSGGAKTSVPLKAGVHQLALIFAESEVFVDNFAIARDKRITVKAELTKGRIRLFRDGNAVVVRDTPISVYQSKPVADAKDDLNLQWEYQESINGEVKIGRFFNLGQRKWKNISGNLTRYDFVQIRHTNVFTELYDETRNLSVILYKDGRSENSGGGRWNIGLSGKWVIGETK
jgi:serine/threonine protein kinase